MSTPMTAPLPKAWRHELDGLRKYRDGEMLLRLIARGGIVMRGQPYARQRQFLDRILGQYLGLPETDIATRDYVARLKTRLSEGEPRVAPQPSAGSARTGVEALAKALDEAIARHHAMHDRLTKSLTQIGAGAAHRDDLGPELRTLMRQNAALAELLREGATRLSGDVTARSPLLQPRVPPRFSAHDPLTGLPNRTAFLQRLIGEVQRSHGQGGGFALALLDLDGLRRVNESHGTEAGDAVLGCYGHEIFGQFRSHDVAARYGDDEFAVLFPQTQPRGAKQALDSAMLRASHTRLAVPSTRLHLPTFTGALAVYRPGERPESLIRRAGLALIEAKRSHREHVVVADENG